MLLLSLYFGLCFAAVYVSGNYSPNDFDLHFQNKGVSDYVNIWGMRSLTQFTVCFWMKSRATNHGTPFSYNVPGKDNELLVHHYGNFELWIGSDYRRTRISANDGRWHHICVSWKNTDGAWQFYKDGVLHHHSINFMKGYTIKARGSLVLGQEQDRLASGFEANQLFQGTLTNVNVWSFVLSPETIKAYSKSCSSGVGNVYKWSDFIYGVKGRTAVVIPSACSPLSV